MLKKLFENQKGMGIAITIMSLVLIAILGTALVVRGMTLANVITKKNYSITAVEAAKAGVSYAIYMVEQDPDCNTPLPPTPLTTYTVTDQKIRGYYEVQIKNNINGTTSVPSISGVIPNIPAGKVEIVATGYCGYVSSANYKSKARVIAIGSALLEEVPLVPNAITGKTSIRFTGNGKVVSTGYNSSDPNTYANIAVNSTASGAISTGHNTVVNGYIYGGNDPNTIDDVVSGGISSSNYKGTLVLPAPIPLMTDITAPSFTLYPGTITISNNQTVTLEPGYAYDFGGGTVGGGNNSVLVFKSGKYVIASDFKAASKLDIRLSISNDAQGNPIPVEIYCEAGHTFKFTGQSIMRPSNETTLASDIIIYGSNGKTTNPSYNPEVSGYTDIEVSGQGETYGIVYNPDGDVTYTGQGTMYGAIIGDNVEFKGNGNLQYPPYLNNSQKIKINNGVDNNNITWSWSYGY